MVIDGPEIEFLVTVPRDGVVAVRWDRPLGRPKTHAYQELATLLEELDGVEWIKVGRYSAELGIADHVTTVQALAEAVHAELVQGLAMGEFGQAVRFVVQHPRLKVTLGSTDSPKEQVVLGIDAEELGRVVDQRLAIARRAEIERMKRGRD